MPLKVPPNLEELLASIRLDPAGRERRGFHLERLEVRQEEGEPARIFGHAAVFNVLSEPIWGLFREKIRPGAFSKTIQEADIRALIDHESRLILGRNKAETLRLAEDDLGLAIEIDPPETTYAQDLMISIRRGDVSQMSFGFRPVREDFERDDDGNIVTDENDLPVRVLQEVELFDVSPVTFPAYPQTSVQARDLLRSLYAPPRREGSHSAEDELRDLMAQTHQKQIDAMIKG